VLSAAAFIEFGARVVLTARMLVFLLVLNFLDRGVLPFVFGFFVAAFLNGSLGFSHLFANLAVGESLSLWNLLLAQKASNGALITH